MNQKSYDMNLSNNTLIEHTHIHNWYSVNQGLILIMAFPARNQHKLTLDTIMKLTWPTILNTIIQPWCRSAATKQALNDTGWSQYTKYFDIHSERKLQCIHPYDCEKTTLETSGLTTSRSSSSLRYDIGHNRVRMVTADGSVSVRSQTIRNDHNDQHCLIHARCDWT